MRKENSIITTARKFISEKKYKKALSCYAFFQNFYTDIADIVKVNKKILEKRIWEHDKSQQCVMEIPVFDNKDYTIEQFWKVIEGSPVDVKIDIIQGPVERSYLLAWFTLNDFGEEGGGTIADTSARMKRFLEQTEFFDAQFYEKQYKPILGGKDALTHFVQQGFAEGKLPARWFDLHVGTDQKVSKILEEAKQKSAPPDVQPKVSVLVPVYNNAQYLHECIDSILNQTLKDIEIIIVNDGSTDKNAVNILNSYARNDNRIRLIHKKNTGYGHSMNCGIYCAKGKYIGIVESDDYIDSSMYNELFFLAKKYNLDCVKSDSYAFYGEKENRNFKLQLSRCNNREYNKILYPYKDKSVFSFSITCAGIYKRELILNNNIMYHETPGSSFQDIGFSFLTNCYINSIYYISKPYYFYRQDNCESSIHKKNLAYLPYEQYKYVEKKLIDDYKKYITFSTILYYRIYINFIYTYNRISVKYKKDFIQFVSMILSSYLRDKKLDKSLFSKNEYMNLIEIINNPINFYKKTCQLPIVFVTNDEYVKPLCCAIASLISNTVRSQQYNIFILYIKIAKENIIKLKKLQRANVSINFMKIDDESFESIIYESKHYSREMFIRFLIPEIFNKYERVVYLDCDMILKKDISKLFYMDIQNTIGAVKNYCNTYIREYVTNELKINHRKYFNSGMLIFDVQKFNKRSIKKQLISHIDSKNKYEMPDQDILNICLYDDVTYIDPTWNFQWHNYVCNKYSEILEPEKSEYIKSLNNINIIHYTSSVKPWENTATSLSNEFKKYEKLYNSIESIIDIFKYKISVIIPVYNAEKYLSQCIESILNQTTHCEIICINDGSTDYSCDILEKYAKTYKNVILINQNNIGAGESRNRGLEIAQGEYVYFLDADDYCPDQNILEKLYTKAEEYSVEICGGSLCYDSNGIVIPPTKREFFFEKNGIDSYASTQQDYGYQRYIYNRNFIIHNSIKFPSYRRFQDPVFLVKAMYTANMYYAIKDYSYCYRMQNNIKWSEDKALGLIQGIRDNIIFAKNNKLEKLYKRTLGRLNNEYKHIIKQYSFSKDINRVKDEIDRIININ